MKSELKSQFARQYAWHPKVPKGRLRVAQRFIAGFVQVEQPQVPSGTTELRAVLHSTSVVPPGLSIFFAPRPASELASYSRMSLTGHDRFVADSSRGGTP
jgi:hypothetical protein